MRITLIIIGKINEKYLEEGISVYVKRLKNYVKFEIKDVKNFSNPDELQKKEALLVLEKVKEEDYLVVLDEKGIEMTSVEFAEFISHCRIHSTKHLVFCIGGAYGIHETLKIRANKILSFSQMTFSHQMIRLFFVEQLYRAFSIIKNEKYHNP